MQNPIEPQSDVRGLLVNSSGDGESRNRVWLAKIPLTTKCPCRGRVAISSNEWDFAVRVSLRVNNVLSLLLAIVIAVAFYGALIPFHGTMICDDVTERGPTQYFTVLFLCLVVSDFDH